MNIEMLRQRLAKTTDDAERACLVRAIAEEEARRIKDEENRDPEPPVLR